MKNNNLNYPAIGSTVAVCSHTALLGEAIILKYLTGDHLLGLLDHELVIIHDTGTLRIVIQRMSVKNFYENFHLPEKKEILCHNCNEAHPLDGPCHVHEADPPEVAHVPLLSVEETATPEMNWPVVPAETEVEEHWPACDCRECNNYRIEHEDAPAACASPAHELMVIGSKQYRVCRGCGHGQEWNHCCGYMVEIPADDDVVLSIETPHAATCTCHECECEREEELILQAPVADEEEFKPVTPVEIYEYHLKAMASHTIDRVYNSDLIITRHIKAVAKFMEHGHGAYVDYCQHQRLSYLDAWGNFIPSMACIADEEDVF
jgi:hypothetical protein